MPTEISGVLGLPEKLHRKGLNDSEILEKPV